MSSNVNEYPNGSFHQDANDDNEACLIALHLSIGPMIYTAALKAAIELNLFEIISKATSPGLSASDIASKLPTQHPQLPRRLDRILCLLASHSLLTCSSITNEDGTIERLYLLSLAGKYFVTDEIKGSVASHAMFLSHRKIVDVLHNFKEVLLDCDSYDLFKKVLGVPIYETVQSDPILNNVFNKAMVGMCTLEMNKVLEIYSKFEDITLLVDVGGGFGQNLNMVISKYPSIKGINFDLPTVIQNAPDYPGIQHIGGDMFENIPKGDAIILKAVLHNWSNENCLQILSNCYKALPQNGKVIVVEFIMPEAIQSIEKDKLVTSYDNLMLIGGGSERTEKEFENLCKSSGFSNFELVCCAFSAMGVMEFHK